MIKVCKEQAIAIIFFSVESCTCSVLISFTNQHFVMRLSSQITCRQVLY